jgi:plasmid stability protein
MQYTVRNVPPHLDQALRERARREKQSLNQMLLDTLMAALDLTGKPVVRRDLSDVAGTWVEDPEQAAAFEEQRRIDPELWR